MGPVSIRHRPYGVMAEGQVAERSSNPFSEIGLETLMERAYPGKRSRIGLHEGGKYGKNVAGRLQVFSSACQDYGTRYFYTADGCMVETRARRVGIGGTK